MIIVGAKGFAKEVLELVIKSGVKNNEIAFFDNINLDTSLMYDEFKILHTEKEVEMWFNNINNSFVLGLGNPLLRKKMHSKMISLGGKENSVISNCANIGSYDTKIGVGAIICDGVRITNSVNIGKNCLINLNVTIGHDSIIGNFVEICPNSSVSGNCVIGDFTFIGTGVTINPGIKIGKRVIIGSGAVVTKNIPNDVKIVGIPAKII